MVPKGALGFANHHVGVGDHHGLGDEGGFVVRVDTQWKSGVAEDMGQEIFCDFFGRFGPEWYRKRVSDEAVDHD